jgi:TrmH family RNA methyltransferase
MSPPVITSKQNPRVKDAVRLRTGSERRERGRFLIDGRREIERAIAAGVRCLEAFVREDTAEAPECKSAIDAVGGSGAEVFIVSGDVYTKLAFGERDDGIVVVAETPTRTLNDLQLPEKPLVAVIEGVEKPGNVGASLRSADAAGVDAVIVADGRTDLYNPNTIRASLGTVFRPNVCEAASTDTLDWLRSRKLTIVAARPDAKQLYTDVDYKSGIAIVLGSEADGLTEAWSAAHITPVRLPMHGIADSLNVSTTAAVLFYEALRQRAAKL